MVKKQEGLFDETPDIEIVYPIYYKNHAGTKYTCLHSNFKFEELTISRDGESFRGCILFGFNEQAVSFKNEQLMYRAIERVHYFIEQSEYDTIFNAILSGRETFFDNGEGEYVEIVHTLNQEQLNKYIKHRWKPIQF